MSLKTNLIIVNYLNEYPLFGSKFLDYNNYHDYGYQQWLEGNT
jgi:hypothetical protein